MVVFGAEVISRLALLLHSVETLNRLILLM